MSNWHIEARYTDRSGGVTGYNISAEDHHVCDAMSASMRDAHLIAAAPALYAALSMCVQRLSRPEFSPDANVVLEKAEAALSAAKAWSSPTPKEAEA